MTQKLAMYVYDIVIYAGKAQEVLNGHLGERVVKKLASSLKEKDVTLAFNRFFTSVPLMKTLNFPAVEICMKNRKNMPKVVVEKPKRESPNFKDTNMAFWF